MARPIQIKVGEEIISGEFIFHGSLTGDYGQVQSPVIFQFDRYYPYDNGNGQPIYDENTGAELRDPVTGEPK
jgi:hypothetical protein